MPAPLFPIQRPWNSKLRNAVMFARELTPCSLAKVLFRAFMSAETCIYTINTRKGLYRTSHTYPRFVVALALLLLEPVALEHRPKREPLLACRFRPHPYITHLLVKGPITKWFDAWANTTAASAYACATSALVGLRYSVGTVGWLYVQRPSSPEERAMLMTKYTGNVRCCSVPNCWRGSVLKAITPAGIVSWSLGAWPHR